MHDTTSDKTTHKSSDKDHAKNNVQDVFLNHLRKDKIATTIFLVNGVKLQGIVTWFDNFSLLLRRDAHAQLVYKHAIATILPNAPLHLFDDNGICTSETIANGDTKRGE